MTSFSRYSLPDPLVVKVLGIGGAGVRTVDAICRQGFRSTECGFIDNDLQALAKLPYRHLFPTPFVTHPAYMEDLQPNTAQRWLKESHLNAQRAFKEIKAKVDAFLKHTDLLIVVSPQGGQVGGLITPVVTEHARKKGIHTVVLSSLPSPTDTYAYELAQYTRTLLNPETVDAYHMPPLGEDAPVSRHDYVEFANDAFAQTLQSTLTVLERRAQMRLDFNAFRMLLTDGQPATIEEGYCPLEEPRALTHALYQMRESQRFLNTHHGWVPDTALLYFLGDPGITMSTLRETIAGADNYALQRAVPMLGFYCGPEYQGEARFILMTSYRPRE